MVNYNKQEVSRRLSNWSKRIFNEVSGRRNVNKVGRWFGVPMVQYVVPDPC